MDPSTQDTPTAGPEDTPEPSWTPRLILSLFGIVLVVELLSLSYQMISVSLPLIAGHFHTTQGAWLLTAFLLVGAVTAPLLGKLADIYGKRKLLLTAIAVTAAGSLLSAVAPSYGPLIAGRALQGFLVPCMFLSYSLIRDVYPPKTVALSVSITTGGMGLITIPAPWVTGWLIDNWGFRSVFWFTLITLAVLGPMIFLTTPETQVRLRSRIDPVGAVLLCAGVAGVLVGVSFGPTWGWGATRTVAYLIGGVVLLCAWAASSRIIREPLIDLSFFGRRPVVLTAVTAGLANGALATYNSLMPVMAMTPVALGLHYGFGVSAKEFAIFAAPAGATGVVGGLLVGLAIRKVQPRTMMILGLLLLAASCGLTGYLHDGKAPLIGFALLFGLGMGMTAAAAPNLVIASVPPELQATTSSMVAVFQSGVAAITPVVAFSVLNSHIGIVLRGNVFYTDSGIRYGFLIGAGTALAGAIIALAIPRTIRQLRVSAATESASAVDGSGEAVAVA